LSNNKPGRNKGVLLASFITTDDEEAIMAEVQFIADNLDLSNHFIFLFENGETPSQKILTYNLNTSSRQGAYNPRLFTMRIHRKKHTNTLYTINGLNLAVAAQNDGKTGRHLKIDWETYRESLLLSVEGKLKVLPVRVKKIFKIEMDAQSPTPSPQE